MNPTQKQFSLNRVAFRKQIPISQNMISVINSVAKRWALLLGAVALLAALPQTAARGDEGLPKGFYTLTGVKVTPLEQIKGDKRKSARLTQRIQFSVQASYGVVKGTEAMPFKVLNPTVGSKSSLTLDKAIKFKGEEVPAGTNLLKYKKFDGAFFNVHVPDLTPFAVGGATIMKDFELRADTYHVKFEWTTDQGEVISETVKVFIDVDLAKKQ